MHADVRPFADPTRCPRCGERVSAFAAGCALCGADLDIRRFARRRWWQRPPRWWTARAAAVAAAAAIAYAFLHRGGPSASVRAVGGPARHEAAVPADAQRVVAAVRGGAAPATQRAALRRYLLGRGVDAAAVSTVLRHSRDGVGLLPARQDTGTRIGGRPVLPAGAGWPRSPAGYPLDFIAVIDFATLPHVAPLPAAGRLVLYYEQQPDDPDFMDPVVSTRAYYLPPGAPSSSPRPPRETYPIAAVHLSGRRMSFSGDAETVVSDTPPGPRRERLIKAMNDVTTADLQPSHLLGTPFEVQGPVLEELSYDLSGKAEHVRPDSLAKYTQAERRDPRQWVLLAQIDEEGDLTLADGGVLLFAILRSDLAAGRFDRVAGILQSH